MGITRLLPAVDWRRFLPRLNTTFDALLVLAWLLIAFLLLGPLLTIPLHIPLSYNEGWNAYFDLRAVHPRMGPLYPPAGSLVFNNYPPLSFYLVGIVGNHGVGDLIAAGRTVALASLLVCAGLLGRCVTLLGGDRRGSLTAAVLLLLYASTFYRDYAAMDDPQWLAHAFMLGGLAVLLGGSPAKPARAWRAAAAAVLMVIGGFVKHNLLALPLTVTVWLMVADGAAAGAWLAAGSSAVVLGAATTMLLHPNAATDILAYHRIFRLGRITKAMERLAPLLPMMLIAVASGLRRGADDRPMRFAVLFAAIALVIGIPQRLGEGVYYNAHFETLIALCLVSGLAVSRLPRASGSTIGPAAIALLAALPVIAGMPWLWHRPWHDIADREQRARAWQPIIAQIAASPGMVGCESLSLCFWAGKPFAVDLFNLDQSVLTGGSIARFAGLARQQAFGVFEESGDVFSGDDPIAALTRDPLLRELTRSGYVPVAAGPDGVRLFAARAIRSAGH